MKVPPLALDREYKELAGELLPRIEETLKSGHFVLGPNVKRFEENFAKWVGTPFCVGVASGTDALYLAFRMLGVGKGDEVITTPFTYFATVEGIVRAGATPVLVDIDPKTFLIDPKEIAKKITKKTRALLPVHLYGQCVDMDALGALAKKHNLFIVEDVAQAHGATMNGKRAGSFGEAGCFSFYPTKNLGAYGDGGAITVKDEKLSKRLRELRVHATPPEDKYFHKEFAANSRLDELQAVILDVKLRKLDGWIKMRQEIAKKYDTAFATISDWVITPLIEKGRNHVYHQYTIRSPHRDGLMKFLSEKGIFTSVYYPHPAHVLPPLKEYGYKAGDLPEAERASREALSLPCFPQMTEGEQGYVCEMILKFGQQIGHSR